MEAAQPTGGTPRTIGLTGGIASGKSTVGRLLRAVGAEVIDADEVARAVVEPGRPAYDAILAAFGREILLAPAPTGAVGSDSPPIDRAALAARVFADPAARATLNGITHPEIARESAARMAAARARGVPLIVYEATLLVENGSYLGFDGLLVVDVPEEIQVARAIARGLSRDQARARQAAQTSRASRRAAANWIIDNRGDEAQLLAAVRALYPDLLQAPIPPRASVAGPTD